MMPVAVFQKPLDQVARFWDSTGTWRLTYFDDLKQKDPQSLSRALQAEQEFVLAEDMVIGPIIERSHAILELGCGVGRSLFQFITRFRDKKFVGVDIARNQINLFQERLESNGLSHASGQVADVASLPFAESAFDAVLICNQTFGNFLGPTRSASLQEAHRVLVDGGVLYIGGFDQIELSEECYAAWGVEVQSIDPDSGFIQLAGYNTYWQPEADVNALVRACGFSLVESRRVRLGYLNVYGKIA